MPLLLLKNFAFLRFCLFLFLSFAVLTVNANTFTVTSNADNGPGSLRDAITLANANGTATTDSIVFAIADVTVAGRTISLLTELPYLSSNLVIDGTTENAPVIGVSDAKIAIRQAVVVSYVFAITDVQNIKIYGIHFHDISGGFGSSVAIALHNASAIAIGAPGRGNYFTNVQMPLGDLTLTYGGPGFSSDISFQSNIVNLTEDGSAIAYYGGALSLTNVKNLTIGGDQDKEGNFIVGSNSGYSIYLHTDTFAQLNFGYTKLLNNKFGCDFTQTKRLYAGTVFFDHNEYSWYGALDTTDVIIKGNSYDFAPQGSSSGGVVSIDLQPFVIIDSKKGFIDIKSNKINQLTPSGALLFYTNLNMAFSIFNCDNGIIGGPSAGDTNYIAGCFGPGVNLRENKNFTISKNSFWCNYKGITAQSSRVTIPKTNIKSITDYTISGTSSVPNCTMEFFLNKSGCSDCQNGKTYLGSVHSDGSGNWSFTSSVLLDGPVTATATTTAGVTGEFAHPEYEQIPDYREKYPSCNANNGYIHGIKYVAGTRYYWVWMPSGGGMDTLFTEDIDNAGAGWYKFVVEQGPYCSVAYQVYLPDNSPKISDYNKSITQPSCGLNNGNIRNLYLKGSFNKVYWEDASGAIVGSSPDLNNVGAGQYKLVIIDTVNGCGDSTLFYTLANQSGPSLDLGAVSITAAVCNQNGAITGIKANNVTGYAFVQWIDSLGRPVGNAYDLKGVPSGKYRFKFKDSGGCDTITTNYFIVPDKGSISLDTAGMLVTASKCSGPSGTIQNIKVTGADQYQWKSLASNNVVSSAANAYDLAAGNYQLTATNSFGCSATSPVYAVPQSAFAAIGVTSTTARGDFCNQHNGQVKILSFNKDTSHYRFWWVDSTTQQTIGTATQLYNLAAGTYQLFASDSNQCQKMIYFVRIGGSPPPVFNLAGVGITNDQCNLSLGSISSVQVSGLVGPTNYTWLDQNNQPVGNSADLKNIGQGTYTLKITDAGVCTVQSPPFVVTNTDQALPAPSYENIMVPRYSGTTITPRSTEPGSYTLVSNGIQVQQNNTGIFTINNITADTSFSIRRSYGSCTSPATQVSIKVVDKSYFAIPSAFSPNGDGLNDQLNVKVIGYINLSYFRIYNRWGQLIFETHQLNSGWNGTVNGTLQGTGTYVWIAEGKDIKGNTVSDRGTFVLIR